MINEMINVSDSDTLNPELDTETEPFDSFVLQPASKSTNQSNVWRHYKRLFHRSANNTLAPVRKIQDRIVCAECFNRKVIKRYKIFSKYKFLAKCRKKYIFFNFFSYFSYAMTTSTSVLRKHLAVEHKIVITGSNDAKTQRDVSEIVMHQKTLTEMSGRTEFSQRDKRFFVAKETVLMICAALLPFQLVEHKGFQRFFTRTSSRYFLY